MWAEADRLEWAESGADVRPALLELWFRDVVVGSVVLVSLEVTVGATAPVSLAPTRCVRPTLHRG